MIVKGKESKEGSRTYSVFKNLNLRSKENNEYGENLHTGSTVLSLNMKKRRAYSDNTQNEQKSIH